MTKNKLWFEHKNGYVNIDHLSWALNDSGVWSDCKDIQEFGSKNPLRPNIVNMLSLGILRVTLASGSFFSAYQFYKNLSAGNNKWVFNLFALCLTIIGIYYISKYFKFSLGYSGKISNEKIKALTWNGAQLTITFFDSDNEEKTVQLKDIKKEVIEKLKTQGYQIS